MLALATIMLGTSAWSERINSSRCRANGQCSLEQRSFITPNIPYCQYREFKGRGNVGLWRIQIILMLVNALCDLLHSDDWEYPAVSRGQ
jgi:hypothetical protein